MLPMLVASALAHAAPPAAPTYQELMDPSVFPDPQRGMVVEAVHSSGDSIRLRTTGAEIHIKPRDGEVRFRQRIGHQREVAVLKTGVAWEGVEVTHSGSGFARITVDRPSLTLRINGDSLFMLHAREALSASIETRIAPAWDSSFGVHHLIADEWGAFGIYCSDDAIDDQYDSYASPVATYPLPADEVLWVAVCPPKEYDWERSFSENVVWHWSPALGYPPDEVLESWQPHGNTVLLQSAVMSWKDWNLDFVPRLGEEEFARVRETIHRLGMRFIVYTSPHYFLRGTPLEGEAFNSFEGFVDWPPGTPTGENMELFMAAIGRVMRDLKPDGLYFDGQYVENPAALYALARRTRALIGEDGTLEWHSSTALGQADCYLPQADAYCDIILRGELRGHRYGNDAYLRYFVSGYNIHNSIGVLCNNMETDYGTAEQIARVLGVNARYHAMASWLDNPNTMRALDEFYKPRLNSDLRALVDSGCDERQPGAKVRAATVRAERVAFARPPSWGAPILASEFDEIPAGKMRLSPLNPEPFAITGGALQVTGRANAYAFLEVPLDGEVAGFEVRLRIGTDQGQAWGPAAVIRMGDGSILRVGLRSDGVVQLDVGDVQLIGGGHATDVPGNWIHLRARWLGIGGRIETSTDGETWETLFTFEHRGALNAPAAALLIGKVPFNGEPVDYTDPGDEGTSEIDWVRVYGVAASP